MSDRWDVFLNAKYADSSQRAQKQAVRSRTGRRIRFCLRTSFFGATHFQSGTDLVGVSSTPDSQAMTQCPLAILKNN